MEHKMLFEVHNEIHQRMPNENLYFSPGRINLIGEHLDYNGGTVFPGAINLGTYAVISEREDRMVRVYSHNFPDEGTVSIDLDHIGASEEYGWASYVAGAFKVVGERAHLTYGLDITIYGTLPNRSGLSSSASIELLMLYIISDVYGVPLDRMEMAALGRTIENDYLGLPSGIMDQFAIAFGESQSAIALDCRTMEYDMCRYQDTSCEFVVINTNKPRELISSEYKHRKTECEQALAELNVFNGRNETYLCDYDLETLEASKGGFSSSVLYRRAHHVIDENARTLSAISAFSKNALRTFGAYMFDSHDSLKKMYEVTGAELDRIVDTARTLDYVLGARMTGAGFGGSAIALIEKGHFEQFKTVMEREYEAAIGYKPSLYQVGLSTGPTIISKGDA
ncbi:galactokinase [Salinicoccus sp. ID82-1]|uniref:galactokinase n=1 Tax=Salinicoccus sp. ID82-1 TaxID=2820269 RepID=UPI001EFFC6FD|nr:galactokinase [Salinicoccus sp. ID82-1]MCG1008463.1 galactokinase [Salinicoccus sp. ID82-1]